VGKSLSTFSSNTEMFKVLRNNEKIGSYYESKYPHKLPDLFKENACVALSPIQDGFYENSNYSCDVRKLKREKFLSPNEFPGNYVGDKLNSSSSNEDMIEELLNHKTIGDYYKNEYPHKLPELFEKGSCKSKSSFTGGTGGLYLNSKYECVLSNLNRKKFLDPNDFPGNYVSGKLNKSSTNAEMLETLSDDNQIGDYFSMDYPHKLPMLFKPNSCRERYLD